MNPDDKLTAEQQELIAKFEAAGFSNDDLKILSMEKGESLQRQILALRKFSELSLSTVDYVRYRNTLERFQDLIPGEGDDATPQMFTLAMATAYLIAKLALRQVVDENKKQAKRN